MAQHARRDIFPPRRDVTYFAWPGAFAQALIRGPPFVRAVGDETRQQGGAQPPSPCAEGGTSSLAAAHEQHGHVVRCGYALTPGRMQLTADNAADKGDNWGGGQLEGEQRDEVDEGGFLEPRCAAPIRSPPIIPTQWGWSAAEPSSVPSSPHGSPVPHDALLQFRNPPFQFRDRTARRVGYA